MRAPRTLAGRLFLWQVSIVLIVILALGFTLDRVLERDAIVALTSSLASQARQAQQALPADPASMQEQVVDEGLASGVRITVISTDGAVLADSEHDPSTMENHSGRPEVRAALAGRMGSDSRRSATLGTEFLYVAVPPENGVVVRTAVPLTEVRRKRDAIRWALFFGLVAAALAAVIGGLLVTRWVSKPMRTMSEAVARLGEGDLEVRTTPAGPEEVRALAITLNGMAERLESEIRSSRDAQGDRDLILSSMEEGVLLLRADGSVSFFNQAMERHLASSPTAFTRAAPSTLREAAGRAAATRSPVEVEAETGAPARWLRGAAIPVDDEGAVLVVLRDVTESRRLESVRRDFVTNASHELKTPAATIQAAAETLMFATVDDPEVVPRFASQLEQEALRLSRIVSDLLDLSRLESGTQAGQRVALDRLVEEECSNLAAEASEKGILFGLDLHPAEVVGSERDLSILVRNLVDNAIRYSQGGDDVKVALNLEDRWAVLRVSDTGLGIPSRDLSRVFERFYRVDRARSRETGGTGLGLSIVRHVAENHGGTVGVDSELGQGSTFTVRIPAKQAETLG